MNWVRRREGRKKGGARLQRRVLVRNHNRTSPVAQLVRNQPAMQETWVRSLGWEDPLEEGKAAHSSILAWRTPWTIFCLGNPMDRGAWWATFHGVAKGLTGPSFHACAQKYRRVQTQKLKIQTRIDKKVKPPLSVSQRSCPKGSMPNSWVQSSITKEENKSAFPYGSS